MSTDIFDVLKVPLEGINLVEASAGTGKTFSIAVIFLRWILSGKYDGEIDSVAAVTFTNYATSELKERIRLFLEEALRFMRTGDCGEEIIKNVCLAAGDRKEAAERLKKAINNFDRAAVFTIHGFCRRLITENAFELGCSLNTELSEEADVSHETAVAFFRKEIVPDTDGEFLAAVQKEISVGKLEELLSKAGFAGRNRVKISRNAVPDDAKREKLTAVYEKFLREACKIAAERYKKNGKTGFDDLILSLYGILQDSEKSERLKKSVRKRFGLVMIDEFQDTDPVQYFIFRELFCDGHRAVFFIGDPKQSIYSFRNADIFSYIKAAREIEKHYVMDRNFRSSAAAVHAVNKVFGELAGFGIPEITYSGIFPKNEDANPLTFKGIPFPGIIVCDRNSETGWRNLAEIGKDNIIRHICVTAGDMLADGSYYRLNGKPVRPSDIAVLTRTNDLAAEIHDALTEAGIPAVLESDSKEKLYIFASGEASLLFRLMQAALTHGPAEFRALLPTCFYNIPAGEIAQGKDSFRKMYEEFNDCFSEWERKGFYFSFSKFLETEDVLSGLSAEGEKTLNNLRHLLELINKFETDFGIFPVRTCEWFAGKIGRKTGSSAEETARPWNEMQDAVRIMTLHKSKGLEFGIVFFPFLQGIEQYWRVRHRFDSRSGEYEKEISGGETADKNSGRDGIAYDSDLEAVREFYVGLTRAKYLTICYNAERNAQRNRYLGMFFSGGDSRFIRTFKPGIKHFVPEKTETSDETAVFRPPEELSREITADWRISSFSGIISANQDGSSGDYTDEDEKSGESEVSENTGVVPLSVFPNGRRTGTVLHSILEKADFSSDDNSGIIREALLKMMDFSGDELENAVSVFNACIKNIAFLPIFGGKTLKDARPGDMASETEFLLKIPCDAVKGRLSAMMAEKYGTDPLPNDGFPRGFMSGFIDLVVKIDGKYYLVDWKSNSLGLSFEDYSDENIAKNMKKHNYYLQYMIYLAAFDRYLSAADPDYSYAENFGGIRYVFLRGIKEGCGDHGIFYDRPDESFLRRFQQLFEEAE